MSDVTPEKDGWHYRGKPTQGDSRKLVTLEQDGMTWVGVRAYNFARRQWLNDGEPSNEIVKAWRDLPEPAKGYFERAVLHVPIPPQPQDIPVRGDDEEGAWE